jgi:hypothetical protein
MAFTNIVYLKAMADFGCSYPPISSSNPFAVFPLDLHSLADHCKVFPWHPYRQRERHLKLVKDTTSNAETFGAPFH